MPGAPGRKAASRIMVFAYFKKLSASQKRVYRKSDEITALQLTRAGALQPDVEKLRTALERERREEVEVLCRTIARGITEDLHAPPLRVNVHAVRPSASWGELHGLYEPAEGRASALISLWMRTAKHRRVVAFRSFFRTLLHELCHHLDYELFRLPDSFHTEGFYTRESSLFHQLCPGMKERPE